MLIAIFTDFGNPDHEDHFPVYDVVYIIWRDSFNLVHISMNEKTKRSSLGVAAFRLLQIFQTLDMIFRLQIKV